MTPPPGSAAASVVHLLTIGHGTLGAEELVALLTRAGVCLVVDVRSAPGSRRHPQFARERMEEWLPGAGIGYRWERRLGGFRRPVAASRNVALRHPAFRGYADHMGTPEFRAALAGVVDDGGRCVTAVMCAETLWWRCHRRLVADAATLVFGVDVRHLGHDGRLAPHRLTEGARLDGRGSVVYDRVSGPGQPGARRP